MPHVNTPRIRNDLKVTPAEEQGIKYFDVSDPRSGVRMRMYDFEWLIAERRNGARPFDEVASWARESLGLNPSPEDLSQYARRLSELGFFELDAEDLSSPSLRIEDENDPDLTPLPKPTPADLAAEAFEDPPTLSGGGEREPMVVAPPLKSALPETDISVDEEGPTKPVSLPEAPAPLAPPPVVLAPPVLPVAVDRPVSRLTPSPSAGNSTDRLPAAPDAPQKKGGSGALILVVVLMLAVGGVVAYMQFFAPQSAHVSVVLATPREVVRLYDGTGAVKKSEATVLSFGEAGKVSDVVAKGTEAKPGMPLATLESYAQIEKLLTDVKDRAAFYQKQLDTQKAKGNEEEAKKAEAKVLEKKKLMTELEARAAKVRLLAPGTGTVTDVLVSAGGDAKPGEPAVKMGDKRLSAEFKIPAAEAPKAGDAATLQPAAGGATLSGRVTSSAAGTVVVELPDAAPVKTGDQLRLVKKREQNVVPVPASAVVKRDGADTVFVLSSGEARAHKVTIVDRSSPTEVLISSGLAPGDSVITTNTDTLQDGQKASAQ
jgi:multidrug efflux pump subunit AcrA (membrane-fusion protein)